jgi:general secretion pathway protein I
MICHQRVRNQRGFTLLEVLAAVAILAMAVTITFQLFSADLRSIVSSEDYVSATTMANAKMREVLDDDKLSEKSWTERTDDGYRIDVSVSEVMKDRTENLQVKLLEIAVTVSWASGTKTRSIALNTMKVMAKQI